MPYVGEDFDPADPSESDTYSFDFSERLAANEVLTGGGAWTLIVTPDSAAQDPSPASRLIGAPSLGPNLSGIASCQVAQLVGNLVANVKYRISATVTTSSGRTLTASSHIPPSISW
jgi:hypothetical protein